MVPLLLISMTILSSQIRRDKPLYAFLYNWIAGAIIKIQGNFILLSIQNWRTWGRFQKYF